VVLQMENEKPIWQILVKLKGKSRQFLKKNQAWWLLQAWIGPDLLHQAHLGLVCLEWFGPSHGSQAPLDLSCSDHAPQTNKNNNNNKRIYFWLWIRSPEFRSRISNERARILHMKLTFRCFMKMNNLENIFQKMITRIYTYLNKKIINLILNLLNGY